MQVHHICSCIVSFFILAMLHLLAYAAEFQRQRDDESFVSAYSGYSHEERAPGDGQSIE
jgi:hypothetical protein